MDMDGTAEGRVVPGSGGGFLPRGRSRLDRGSHRFHSVRRRALFPSARQTFLRHNNIKHSCTPLGHFRTSRSTPAIMVWVLRERDCLGSRLASIFTFGFQAPPALGSTFPSLLSGFHGLRTPYCACQGTRPHFPAHSPLRRRPTNTTPSPCRPPYRPPRLLAEIHELCSLLKRIEIQIISVTLRGVVPVVHHVHFFVPAAPTSSFFLR